MRYHHRFRDPARIEFLPLLKRSIHPYIDTFDTYGSSKRERGGGTCQGDPARNRDAPHGKKTFPVRFPSDLPGRLKPLRRKG